MAVVEWRRRIDGDEPPVMRNMMAPKRAGELKYWWVEARKAIPAMPKWDEKGPFTIEDITIDTIILEGMF
ncbi:hypothetical protein, partial [Parvimonas micra]|uniref:hypothetical protein n=1 Tax=Parvimonas micra TaxID=33033 RepID=UPI002B47854E